jgi:predicted nucleic-acid-binding Zn-ribbon protein
VSADNVGVCPNCGDQELREYWEFLTDAEERGEWGGQPISLTLDYSCTCRRCGYEDKFEHRHTYATDATA